MRGSQVAHHRLPPLQHQTAFNGMREHRPIALQAACPPLSAHRTCRHCWSRTCGARWCTCNWRWRWGRSRCCPCSRWHRRCRHHCTCKSLCTARGGRQAAMRRSDAPRVLRGVATCGGLPCVKVVGKKPAPGLPPGVLAGAPHTQPQAVCSLPARPHLCRIHSFHRRRSRPPVQCTSCRWQQWWSSTGWRD